MSATLKQQEATTAPALAFDHKESLWQKVKGFPLSLKFALFVIAVLVFIGIAAPLLAPHDPLDVDVTQKLQGWSSTHWLGTDYLGRDMLSRLLYGTRYSVGVTAIVLSLVFLVGLIVGGVAGFFGGKVDSIIMRVCDIFMTIPSTVLAVFFVGVLGVGITNVGLAMVLSQWPWYARIEQSADINLLTPAERAQGYYFKFIAAGLLRGALKDQGEYFARALGSGGSPAWMTQDEVRALDELNPMGGEAAKLPPRAGSVPAPVAA